MTASCDKNFQQKQNFGGENVQRYVGPCLISNRISNNKGASRVYFGRPLDINVQTNSKRSSNVSAEANNRRRSEEKMVFHHMNNITGAPLINFRYGRGKINSRKSPSDFNAANDKFNCSLDLASLGVGLVAVGKIAAPISAIFNSTTPTVDLISSPIATDKSEESKTLKFLDLSVDSGLEIINSAESLLSRRKLNSGSFKISSRKRRKKQNFCNLTDCTSNATTLQCCKCHECSKPRAISFCYLSIKRDATTAANGDGGLSTSDDCRPSSNTPPLITISVPPNCCIIKDDDSLKLTASFTSEEDEEEDDKDSSASSSFSDRYFRPSTADSLESLDVDQCNSPVEGGQS